MKSRLSIDYLKNEIASINCGSELVDMNLQCRLEKGETFFFISQGYEWMGECTGVHHLFYELIENSNDHLPMFKLQAHAVRKLKS